MNSKVNLYAETTNGPLRKLASNGVLAGEVDAGFCPGLSANASCLAVKYGRRGQEFSASCERGFGGRDVTFSAQ